MARVGTPRNSRQDQARTAGGRRSGDGADGGISRKKLVTLRTFFTTLVIGVLLIIGPLLLLPAGETTLLLSDNAVSLPDGPVRQVEYPTRIAALYPVAYWLGVVLLIASISIAITLAVEFDAVVAGKLSLFGAEIPVKIGGAALLMVALMGGSWFVTDHYNLTDIGEKYSWVAEIQEGLETAQSELEAAQNELSMSQTENATLAIERDTHQQILTGQLERNDGIDLLRIEIQCPNVEEPLPVWWEPPRGRRVVTSHIGEHDDEALGDSVRLQMSSHTTFGLRTSDGRSLVDATFDYRSKDREIVATLSLPSSNREPATLREFCQDVEESLRDDPRTDRSSIADQ